MSAASGSQNVKVFFRFRNNTTDGQNSVKFLSNAQVEVFSDQMKEKGHRALDYSFDRVWDKDVQQNEVYTTVGKPLLDNIFEGFNSTLFVYGQTGSGKTFTMFGPDGGKMDIPELEGIVPRVMKEMFQRMKRNQARDSTLKYEAEVEVVDVYLEKVRDLLNRDVLKKGTKANNCKVRWGTKEGVTLAYSDNTPINKKKVTNYFQVQEAIESAIKIRKKSGGQAKTKMNEFSSRSHICVRVILKQESPKGIQISKLMLCDLAGSEKVRNTGATGKALTQAKNINYGLSVLGNVLNALTATRNKRQPPYMDSKLTRILMDSLGGNCKTSLICAARPDDKFSAETLGCLRFGKNAKKIKNKAVKGEILTPEQYQSRINTYKSKIQGFEATIKLQEKRHVRIKSYAEKLTKKAEDLGLDVQEFCAKEQVIALDDIENDFVRQTSAMEEEGSDLEEEKRDTLNALFNEDENGFLNLPKRQESTPRTPGSSSAMRRRMAELMYQLEAAQETVQDLRSEVKAKEFALEQCEIHNENLTDEQQGWSATKEELTHCQGSNYQLKKKNEYLAHKNRELEKMLQSQKREQDALSQNIWHSCADAMTFQSEKEIRRIQTALIRGDNNAIVQVVTELVSQAKELERQRDLVDSMKKQNDNLHQLREKELAWRRKQDETILDVYAKYKIEKSSFECGVDQRENTISILRAQVEELKRQRNCMQRQLDMIDGKKNFRMSIGKLYNENPSRFFKEIRASVAQRAVERIKSVKPDCYKKVMPMKRSISPIQVPGRKTKVARSGLGMVSPVGSQQSFCSYHSDEYSASEL